MTKEANFYRQILDNLSDGVYFVDRSRKITFWNKGAERITGFSSEDVIGYSCGEHLLRHVDQNGTVLCLHHCPLTRTLKDGEPHQSVLYLHHADGHRLPVLVQVTPFRNEAGEIIGGVETFSDNNSVITNWHQVNQLKEVAFSDVLTGTGNRRHLETEIRNWLDRVQESQHSLGAIFLDIDNFKEVNDTWGHDAGDRVLKLVSTTLEQNIRRSDMVGRWGGDEFLVLLPEVEPDHLELVVKKLLALVESLELEFENVKTNVTISIGATLSTPEDNLESLMNRVDKLLYKSKKAGRNRFTIG